MTSKEIRNSFLEFFRSKDHRIVPSAPVVPKDDPTLLFINAGMNQFKDVFLGTGKRDFVRVANSQKCIRVSGKHNDLEEVGRDTYHHTFFEMLGNWSFGDYFKAEAIEWAWELLTEVWKLPKADLYATVFEGDAKDGVPPDDEAAQLWKKVTGIDPSHVLKFGKKDNFWEMGETGPCGPCSEIHIDRGPGYCDSNEPDHVCKVNGGCARFIELWNLVFIQFNRDENGQLHELPAKHVDTGAGLERIVAVIQNKVSNYDTDLFQPIQEAVADITGKEYTDGEQAVAFCVLCDHIRALSFAIADGAIPGNEGRGYVLRRLLRRAARFGRILDMHEPFFYKLISPLVDVMGDAYPELKERHQHIARVLKAEEEGFGRTLDRGIEIFEEKVAKVLETGATTFPGMDAFMLHDTYGFPLDLTQLMAREKGLSVDVAEFDRQMAKQRERSSQARTAVFETIDVQLPNEVSSEFVGYQVDEIETEVIHYEDGRMVLQRTPFYTESGGQVGDTGKIANDGFEFNVRDTKKVGDHIVHIGEIELGNTPETGIKVVAGVDVEKRRATERNHTATHLLHKALRTILGEHVQQAGSLVHPEYLRFDFTHFEKVSNEELEKVEDIVNASIRANYLVSWQVLPFDEAKERGAIALFGEKYGDKVRMVEVDDYSRELCGGTHVRATGEIGYFVIRVETAVAAGVRRIEAITGEAAVKLHRSEKRVLSKSAQILACRPEDISTRIEALLIERKNLKQKVHSLRKHSVSEEIAEIVKKAKFVENVAVVAAEVSVSDIDELKNMADELRDRLGSGVGLLGTVIENKLSFACVVTKDLIDHKKLNAGNIVREVAKIAGGGGGGRPHMALAGGKDVSKIGLALSNVVDIVKNVMPD